MAGDDLGDDEVENLINPDTVEIYFTKSQRDTQEFPDGYRAAKMGETSDGREKLRITLSLAQAQGWADTLAAKLYEHRTQVVDYLPEVTEVYLVIRDQQTNREVEGVAFRKKDAEKRKAELERESQADTMTTYEIETVEFITPSTSD